MRIILRILSRNTLDTILHDIIGEAFNFVIAYDKDKIRA